MITIKLDASGLEYALERLAQAAKVDLGKVIKQEGGNIAKTIMLIVPPTTGPAGIGAIKPRSSGWSKNAQEQGINAIKGDLFGGKNMGKEMSVGLFQRIGNSTQVPPRRGAFETTGIRLGWEGSKTIRIMKKFWQPGASLEQMHNFRKRYQNKRGRTGAVTRSAIGRWQVQDQMWISDYRADAYFKMLSNRVGWHKAGFAAAAIACGIRVPSWIRKHAAAAGSVVCNFGGPNPFVMATAHGVKIPDFERYVESAIKIREKVTLQKIQRIHSNIAVNLGFAKVSGDGKVAENMP